MKARLLSIKVKEEGFKECRKLKHGGVIVCEWLTTSLTQYGNGSTYEYEARSGGPPTLSGTSPIFLEISQGSATNWVQPWRDINRPKGINSTRGLPLQFIKY